MKNKNTERCGFQRAAQAALITAMLFVVGQAGSAAASDRHSQERQAADRSSDARHESKIYGTVESMPKDGIGVWVVNGREITVDKNTRIKEKHGKTEVGAYVKIEGFNRDKAFVADEIEVKQARPAR